MRTDLCSAVAAAALLLSPAAAAAQSSYSSTPFRDHAVDLAQAAALERIAIAARALAVGPASNADGQEDEEEEGGPLADLTLIRATLSVHSPEVAASLAGAIDAMVEAAEDGTVPADPAQKVMDLVAKARTMLVPSNLADKPDFRAALMASLLLDEGGVAEGYEEAVEGDVIAYREGYFAFLHVRSLWEPLSAQAEPERLEEVEAMLAILDDLFPAPHLPDDLHPDPEQAEAPAQQLVGLLEVVADADLYPGRHVAGATGLVHEIAKAGCEDMQAEQGSVGAEKLTIAAAYYAQTVRDTLSLLAPDVATDIAVGLDALAGGRADACVTLLAALEAGRKVLTP